jgi:regulator of sigma E protease
MDILGSTIISLLAMLVTLGILVTIHEYGHFIVARLCGVRVERFSIGFGKPLLAWKGKPGKAGTSSEVPTEYVISALPLGGYVKMLGEQEDDIGPDLRKQSFGHKSLLQRTAIVAAGPVANFLLAIILYWCVFLAGVSGLAPVVGDVEPGSAADQATLLAGDEIVSVDGQPTSTWQDVRIALLDRLGESGTIELQVSNQNSSLPRTVSVFITDWLGETEAPDLLGSLGLVPYHQVVPPVIEEVVAGGRAEAAGLQPGDLIVASNNEVIRNWSMWLDVVRNNPETALAVEVLRDGYTIQTGLTPAVRLAENGEPELTEEGAEQGYIGASVVVPQLPDWMNRTQAYSVFAAVQRAFAETLDNSIFVLDSIGKMLTGNISVKNLSGPITIAQVAGETATYGLEYYISFLALLSISLGVLNLLPIPVLDGGHLFYYAIEALIRRPVPRRIQELGMQVGMMLVGCIMLLALFNDVNRLF